MKDQEIWRDVVGFEKLYQVSNFGNVKSFDRIDSIGRKVKGRVLKQSPNDKGYLTIRLYLNSKGVTRYTHQIVAQSFLNHEPCGYKLVVDHIDNNKLNNNLTNLQLISQRENSSKNSVGKTSSHTGVFFDLNRNKYTSQCTYKGKQKFLGRFKTELEAAEAYNNYLKTII